MSNTTFAPLPSVTRYGPQIASRVPAGWIDEPYTRFALRPKSPTIGAEVVGADLTALDDVTFADLHRALLEWKVLFFRNTGLDADSHHALGARWGELEFHPFLPTGGEDRQKVVRFEKSDTNAGYENVWHSDVSWRANPSLGSLLRAVEVPAIGGDTLWADMGAAYDYLPDAVKACIDGLTAIHDWIDTFGAQMSRQQRDALRPDFPAQEHPVVRTHPETGRKTIYVNAIFTKEIVGVEPDEGAELLRYLCHQANYPEYQCRWTWQAGDLAIWDNRATQHYATSDYFPQRRIMERITVIGDAPH